MLGYQLCTPMEKTTPNGSAKRTTRRSPPLNNTTSKGTNATQPTKGRS